MLPDISNIPDGCVVQYHLKDEDLEDIGSHHDGARIFEALRKHVDEHDVDVSLVYDMEARMWRAVFWPIPPQ